jgi:hypothetical protein
LYQVHTKITTSQQQKRKPFPRKNVYINIHHFGSKGGPKMNKTIWISTPIVLIAAIFTWLTSNATNALTLLAAYGIILSFLVYFSFLKIKK